MSVLCMYVCMHVLCTYICILVCMNYYMYVGQYVCIHVCIYSCMFVMCVCVYCMVMSACVPICRRVNHNTLYVFVSGSIYQMNITYLHTLSVHLCYTKH